MCPSSLTSTHTSSGGPQARLGGEQSARTPRAPAGGKPPAPPCMSGFQSSCQAACLLRARVIHF